MRFSPEIERCLRKAGWFPGRSVALDSGTSRGYSADHPVWKILAEFGYLQIECEINYAQDFTGYLDIYDSEIRDSSVDDVAMLKEKLGVELALVGLVNIEEEIYVSNDGSVILQGMLLDYWAANFDDFLERILTGKRRAEPPPQYLPGKWPCATNDQNSAGDVVALHDRPSRTRSWPILLLAVIVSGTGVYLGEMVVARIPPLRTDWFIGLLADFLVAVVFSVVTGLLGIFVWLGFLRLRKNRKAPK